MDRVVYGRVQPLDRGGVWVARGVYVENDERRLVPVGVEVRPASLAGEDDARGRWAPLPMEIDVGAIPGGGLSINLLRAGLAWEDRDSRVELVVDHELGELYRYGPEVVVGHLEKIVDVGVRRGILRRGRRDLARSLFTLIEASVEKTGGRPRSRGEIITAVRRVYDDFNDAELRSTIQWARTHQPPLFEPYGPRQRGGRLTRHLQLLLVLIDQLDSLEPEEREAVLRERATDLAEFRQS